MNALDALNKLNAKVKTSSKSEPKKERPQLPVPTAVMIPFQRLVAAKNIAEKAIARQKVEEGLVNEAMMDSFSNTLFANGNQPQNPRLEVERNGRPDMEGLFQVQGRFTFNIDEGEAEIKERAITSLEKAGLPKDQAYQLVTNELDTTPQTTLRPLNELAIGHYEGKTFVEASEKEKAVANKIIDIIVNHLTEEEQALVIRKKDNLEVKDGFLERVKGYCKSVLNVKAVFGVIKPIHFMSRMKFGVSDTPEMVNARLVEEFKQLIGV